MGLALGTDLKLYTSLSKWLKLKVRKLWGLILTFVGVTGEKLVGYLFAYQDSTDGITDFIKEMFQTIFDEFKAQIGEK